MKQGKLLAFLTWIIAMAVLVSGCGGSSATNPADKTPVKIGFYAPVTGVAAADGESSTNAAKLAVEKINQTGGINGRPVELVAYDDGLDPKQAVSIAQKLTTKDGVAAVVSGSYSGTTRASAKIYQDAKIPMIAGYALHPDITKSNNYIFRQSFLGPVQGKAGGKVAVETLKAKTVSILYVNVDFGKTLMEGFKAQAEKMGAKIISEDSFPSGEKEFTPVLTKIKGLNPDLIYMPCYSPEGSQIVRQAKTLGITSKILGTEGIDSTVEFLGVVQGAAEGVVITTNLNRDSQRKVVQEFIADFNKKYGHKPDMVAASVYDAFMVMANAMKTKGVEADKIREGIASTKDFEAVTGIIKGYNQNGEVKKNVQIQVVKDGDFHFFAELTDEDIITPPVN